MGNSSYFRFDDGGGGGGGGGGGDVITYPCPDFSGVYPKPSVKSGMA